LGAFNKDDGESLFFSSYSFIIDQITKIFWFDFFIKIDFHFKFLGT
jgi:hypothetical protein